MESKKFCAIWTQELSLRKPMVKNYMHRRVDGDNKIDILSANNLATILLGIRIWMVMVILGHKTPLHFRYNSFTYSRSRWRWGCGCFGGSYFENLVVWYENLDGLGSFGSQKIISNTADGPYRVISTDVVVMAIWTLSLVLIIGNRLYENTVATQLWSNKSYQCFAPMPALLQLLI